MDISFSTEVESNVDELDEAIARLEQLDGKTAEAGLFDGFAAKKTTWQEYGTSRGIPARPFLRNTQYENENQWGQKIAKILFKYLKVGYQVVLSYQNLAYSWFKIFVKRLMLVILHRLAQPQLPKRAAVSR